MSGLTPPGEVKLPAASEVLVVAPHYDDETLGCGGLLIRMAKAGAKVRVIFLTDGSAGRGDDEIRKRQTEIRRGESEAALAVLGLEEAETRHLNLPDGRLADSLTEVAAELEGMLRERPAQILLCPSPLEASPDHRAAFAALHRLLSRTQPVDALDVEASRVLLYEINRPGYPNLMVDVGAELEKLEQAIRCYASQLEEHDYLGAALGLRRYRTLSLDPAVQAAEAYRELSSNEFRTRSLDRLIRDLGGSPALVSVEEGPTITAIVRTKDRPELLSEALESIAASTYRRLDVLVVNDGGAKPVLPSEFPFPIRLIDLQRNLGRAGAAQRGVEEAEGQAVAFLDDDDLVEPEHYAILAGLAGSSGVRVAYTDAAVAVYEAGGDGWVPVERRLPYSRDFDADRLLLDNYIPFHTLIFERELLRKVGVFDEAFPFFEDWDMLIRLAQHTPFHHLAKVTCEYRHFRGSAHHILGNDPRSRADFIAMKARVYEKHRNLLGSDLVARAVDGLRAEAVEKGEAAATRLEQRREFEEALHLLQSDHQELHKVHQDLHNDYQSLRKEFDHQRGELASLRELETFLRSEMARLDAELARVYGEEKRLVEHGEAQSTELVGLGHEIERQREQIRMMESSRIWRWTEWWRRWRT